ncbi:MAG TPA: LamG domain-containing protein, partial [Bacteroidia bacterium]|nr:LamG domain-containing protein [Bacteroidia bacterium]
MKKSFLLLFIACTFVAKAQTNMGIVAYYPFNGNADDSSGNGLNASINKAIPAADRYGRPNHAYKFVGDSNTYISVPHDTLLNLTGDKTISLWYKIDTLPNQLFPALVLKEGANFYYTTFAIQFNEEAGYPAKDRYKVGFFFGSNSTNYLLSTDEKYNDTANIDKWIHIVSTYSQSTGYSKIYFNGVLSDSLYIGNKNSEVSTQPMQIGRGTSFGNHNGNYFKGYLDDIRLYGRTLTPSEIDSIYVSNDTALNDTSPVLNFKETKLFENINIYPNPAKNQITVANLTVD